MDFETVVLADLAQIKVNCEAITQLLPQLFPVATFPTKSQQDILREIESRLSNIESNSDDIIELVEEIYT